MCTLNENNYNLLKDYLIDYCTRKYGGTHTVGICSKAILKKWREGDVDKRINYTISRFAEYPTLKDVFAQDAKQGLLIRYDYPKPNKTFLKKYYKHYDEDFEEVPNAALTGVFIQFLWQFLQFTKSGLFHKDCHLENAMFFANLDFEPDKIKYYEYHINENKFYIKVTPYIVKLIDFGNSSEDSSDYPLLAKKNFNSFYKNVIIQSGTNDQRLYILRRILPRDDITDRDPQDSEIDRIIRDKFETFLRVHGSAREVDDITYEYIKNKINAFQKYDKQKMLSVTKPTDAIILKPEDSVENRILNQAGGYLGQSDYQNYLTYKNKYIKLKNFLFSNK